VKLTFDTFSFKQRDEGTVKQKQITQKPNSIGLYFIMHVFF